MRKIDLLVTYTVGGKIHGCSMLVGNVHFVLADLYRELGEKRVLDLAMAYADFLTKSGK